ncbi:MAG TPA: UvrD-helicase domain-containing protein [Bacteroidales bacterium]|nr:UvrD-helicase domain-containing protein [Bacteroidales bacterium]HOR82319.1 UvrD-helicase domain-containing protein [Bacteroidales bacterium]HPJ91595.1 UvrD-helicase domain-containing protein [Bacteroidales bacterium]
MKNNKLMISAAGSGKTTYLIDEALALPKEEQVLITTYTEANEAEIRSKILKKKNCIPSNITIQTWFSFLIQHGVRPFQGSMNDELWDNDITGMLLVEGRSGKKYDKNGKPLIINGHPIYWEKDNFKKYYFTTNWKIFSDKLSNFVEECNTLTNGAVISRISRIFSHIYIDEVQDLAGYDLELIKLLFKSKSTILLVGDPRQVTYLTHHSIRNKKYRDGKIKDFLIENCKSLLSEDSIDEETLKKSHRNNKEICDYASKLFEGIYEKSEPCSCDSCRKKNIEHAGVFIVRQNDVDEYLKKYNPVQLRWNRQINVNENYSVYNFGESKGQTYDRVLIYPTSIMINWIKDNSFDFKRTKNGKQENIIGVREKFYVAITRARYSVAIVYNFSDDEKIEGVQKLKL